MGGAVRFHSVRFPTKFSLWNYNYSIETNRIVPKMNMAQSVLCNYHIFVFMVLQHTEFHCREFSKQRIIFPSDAQKLHVLHFSSTGAQFYSNLF